METALLSPPGGQTIRHASPHFAPAVRGPLAGDDAAPELDRVWPMLKAAAALAGDTHRKRHVAERLRNGLAQLWTLPNAACVTSIERHDTGLRDLHGWLAAGDLDGLVAIEARLERFARAESCDRMVIAGRKGWLRIFSGYSERAVILAKDLNR
jgi:hypothetical protein